MDLRYVNTWGVTIYFMLVSFCSNLTIAILLFSIISHLSSSYVILIITYEFLFESSIYVFLLFMCSGSSLTFITISNIDPGLGKTSKHQYSCGYE